MTTAAAYDLGVELCQALGVDPQDTYRVEIIAAAGEFTTVRVHQWERDEQNRLVVIGEAESAAIASVIRTWRQQVGEPVIERES